MPYVLKVEPKLLRLDLVGAVTRADVFAVYAEVRGLEQSHAVMVNRLVLLTEVTLWAASTEAFSEFAARRRATTFPNAFKPARPARGSSRRSASIVCMRDRRASLR